MEIVYDVLNFFLLKKYMYLHTMDKFTILLNVLTT